MKTAGSLSDRSKSELATLAKSRGVRGWAAMDKGALVKALSKTVGTRTAKPAKSAAKTAKTKVVKKGPAKPKVVPKARHPTGQGRPTKPSREAGRQSGRQPTSKTAKPTAPTAKLPPSQTGESRADGQTPLVSADRAPCPGDDSQQRAVKPDCKRTPQSAVTGSLVPAKPKPLVQAARARRIVKPLIPKTPVPPREPSRDAPSTRNTGPLTKDRILLAVSNPYWLNAYWEISPHSVQRAEAALKQDWHGARMIIRLFDVTSLDTTSTSETPVKDIVLQGPGPELVHRHPAAAAVVPGGHRVRVAAGRVLRPGPFERGHPAEERFGSDTGDNGEPAWDDNDAKWKAERILAMSTGFESTGSAELREFFEERTGRTLGPPKETAFGTGAMPPGSVKKFFFEIDAKLIVFGRTDPAAHLTLNNDPIKLNPDGTFRMTFNLPDSRQIIPAVAASADGVEERTIVLAVERTTKHLDPMIHDQMNEV